MNGDRQVTQRGITALCIASCGKSYKTNKYNRCYYAVIVPQYSR